MKKLLLTFLICINFTVQSQALKSAQSFTADLAKMTDVQQLLELSSKNKEAEQYARQELVLNRLLELRPYSPELKMSLVKVYALQDKKQEAYNQLVEIQNAGLSYSVSDDEFANIKTTKVFEYIEDGMAENAKPFGEGKTAFSISSNYSGLLFENLTHDSAGQRFLLGSVRSGAIYQQNEQGELSIFIDSSDPSTGPWGVLDLVADSINDVLWVASATLPQYSGTTPSNFGQAMISKYQLSTGKLLKNFAMGKAQQPTLFTAMHLTAAQNLYFINPFNSQFYTLAKDSEQIESVAVLRGLNNIKAITSNQDETILYVSDFDQGLFAINLVSKQVAPLIKSNKGFFAGINDLFYDGGDLVAIQSGVQPARLMRYVLEKDLFLQSMFPIEAAHPAFDGVGSGVLVGDQVYYVANSQWQKMDALGRLLPDHSWDDVVIASSPTKYKMEEHLAQQQKMEAIKKRRGLK